MDKHVIICNTFKGKVDIVDFKTGRMQRTIPAAHNDYKPVEPSQATQLETGQVVILDKTGITIFGKKNSNYRILAVIFRCRTVQWQIIQVEKGWTGENVWKGKNVWVIAQ